MLGVSKYVQPVRSAPHTKKWFSHHTFQNCMWVLNSVAEWHNLSNLVLVCLFVCFLHPSYLHYRLQQIQCRNLLSHSDCETQPLHIHTIIQFNGNMHERASFLASLVNETCLSIMVTSQCHCFSCHRVRCAEYEHPERILQFAQNNEIKWNQEVICFHHSIKLIQ